MCKYKILKKSEILYKILFPNIRNKIIQYIKDKNGLVEYIGIKTLMILTKLIKLKININKYFSINSYWGNQKNINVNIYKNKINGVKTSE